MELRNAEAHLADICSTYESLLRMSFPTGSDGNALCLQPPLFPLSDLIRDVRAERLPEREAAARDAAAAAVAAKTESDEAVLVAEAEAEEKAASEAAKAAENEGADDVAGSGSPEEGPAEEANDDSGENVPDEGPSEAARRAAAASSAAEADSAASDAASAVVASTVKPPDEEGVSEGTKSSSAAASARELLSALESLRSQTETMKNRASKFRRRLGDTDPITGRPRYGANTAGRVTLFLDLYDAVVRGVAAAFGEARSRSPTDNDPPSAPSLVEVLRDAARRDEEVAAQALAEEERAKADEAALAAEATRAAEEERTAAEAAAIDNKRREEEALRRAAVEAKARRKEEEERAAREAREADRAFAASIPKGPDGVRAQIVRMREGSKSEAPGTFDVAIGALHTIFSQISSHPDEIKFRRIRRDHPKFLEDIGRHPGGKEVLIAAGFKLETLDGVPCFFSREPDVEKDMDGWSAWFDGLKQTLEIIEEEMIK